MKGEKKIPHSIKRRKANRIGHIMRRNCSLKQVMEENMEGKVNGGRKCKQLLYDFKEGKKKIYLRIGSIRLHH